MKRPIWIYALLLGLGSTLVIAESNASNEVAASELALREELLRMMEEDQVARNQRPEDVTRVLAIDKKNTARLKEIIRKAGWPFASLVGADGERAAWLLAQHADGDPEFQRDVLRLLEAGVHAHKTQGSYYAYLHDRLHQPQRYGTQGKCVAEGRWEPRAIEDPANVDRRRAELQMSAMAEYRKLASQKACVGITIYPGPGARLPGS